MRKWIGTSRYVYNKALDKIKKEKEKIDFRHLRDLIVTSKGNKDQNEWEKETPKDVRAGAVKDLYNAYTTIFSSLKKGIIKHFSVKYRRRRDHVSITIPKRSIFIENCKLFFYPKKFIKDPIKVSNDKFFRNINIRCDCRLKNDKGKWYLYVPEKFEENLETTEDVCALDPGVRVFQTIYSKKEVIQIGIEKDKMRETKNKIAKFQSLSDKGEISKKHYKRRVKKIRERFSNLINDIHNRTINCLKKYKKVYLPKFESQELVKKNKSKTVRRNLLNLKHYAFKMRAINKLRDAEICTEEYTSQTCGRCGELNKELGGSEEYNCEECGLKINRDINGARNILIKNMVN